MREIKFYIKPEDAYKRLDPSEKEEFSQFIFTNTRIAEDGTVEITGFCTSEEYELAEYRRRLL